VRIRTITSFILGSAFLLASAAPAAAQTSTKAEVGVSYSILKMYDLTAPIGFAVDFGKQITSVGAGSLGIVGEFGMNRFTDDIIVEDENQFSFMGGVRFAGPQSGKIRPFGQFLVGGLSSFEQNDFAVQPGAGININIKENMDWRVQVDFPIDFAENETFKGFRFNVGLVWWIGQ
jgi:hypothetical protein